MNEQNVDLQKFLQDLKSNQKYKDYSSKLGELADFKPTYSLDTILESWRHILQTPKGTYQYDPEYGSNLHLRIQQPADAQTLSEIYTDIVESLMTYEARAAIVNIDISFLDGRHGFNLVITGKYGQEQGKISITLTSDIYELLSGEE